MTTDQWEHVKAIFASAVEIDPLDREAYVRRASNGDENLIQEVLSLLEADRASPMPPVMERGTAPEIGQTFTRGSSLWEGRRSSSVLVPPAGRVTWSPDLESQ